MKMPLLNKMFAAMIAAVALGAANPARASNFTITSSTSGSSARFIVTRDDTTAAETVNYRTVSLSAYAGQHYTAKSGTLTFPAGQSAVTNTVAETTPTAAAYRFQTGTSRYYRFEITDAGGFLVTNATRSLATGTRVTASDAFGVNNLTIQSSEYTADDRGYDSNGYKSVSSNGYFAAAAPKAYFQLVDAQLRMTLSMDAKENDDAYEYLQLLFDNTTSCDNRSGREDGNPGTINLSSYMAGFEMNTGAKDSTYRTYTFPVTNVANNAGATNPWGYSSNGDYPLSMQRYKPGRRATDGRIIVPLDFSSIVLRLNASGKSGSDEWAAKSVVAHVQAVDATAPTKLDVSVAPGIHAKGNAIYVSVAFSEPVTGSPSLTTSWGSLNYFSGSGSNVLTFKGTIPADATDTLNVTGKIGTISDLAGKEFTGSVSANNLANLDASHTYAITYDLAGGALPEGASNPTTYTYETPSFTLAPPVRPGYNFAGWTEGSGSTPNPSVAIYRFHGDRAYVANWTPITYSVHFDAGAADATGPMPDQTLTYDAPQALSSNAFTRAGYTFAGWRGADGAIHPDGATVLNLTNAQDAVVSLVATWRPNIPYIDADGNEQMCTSYTILTNAACDVEYGTNNVETWYVVTNAVTISGRLAFRGTTHLIVCDGATLTVTNASGIAINAADLTIYGQANGTGSIVANGSSDGIVAAVTINGGNVAATGGTRGIRTSGSVTINGGTVIATSGNSHGIDAKSVAINGGSVTATGNIGISATSNITLGWTTPTDSIYANRYGISLSSYVTVNGSLTDGGNIYSGSVNVSDLAGKTLRPAITYTVRFDANGGTGTMADQTFVYATPQALASNAFTRIGYDFAGWSTNANGAVVYSDGASVSNLTAEANKTVTFYAQWAAHTYTFRFDTGADGVTGAMPDQTFAYDARQALTSNAFTRTGYTFAGWRGADGSIYPDGATVIVRYAYHTEGIWKHFDRMPWPGRSNEDYRPGDGAIQNTDGDNGVNLYTGFENCAWDPTNPALADIISSNAAWFDEHDARYGVSMKLIEDFPNFYIPNFYIEQVDDAQDGVVTLAAVWLPHVPYIDADGNEQMCTDYTVLTNAAGDVEYGEWWGESWYVVTNDVTISGNLWFNGVTNHLILCDGATLTVTNANGTAIGTSDNLAIYCQANGTGMLIVNGSDDGIFAWNNIIINGGSITATGGNGIYALNGSITLGWTNPADSITASSYYANYGEVSVKSNQRLTDGSAIYKDTDDLGTSLSALAGKTLRPYIDTPAYPAYLGLPADPADDTEGDAVIRANYDAWAQRYGYDALGANETAFLLNIAPWATPIELRIAGIEVVEGGARVRVTCRAGASAEAGAVDLSQINGVISVSAGDAPDALAPKAASGITYSVGEATIFVPASVGRFVKAAIGLSAPEEGE